jgi:hypothetical protein
MKNRSSDTEQGPAKQAGKTIPDKPRDCGAHVDTWPILDTEADEAPKPRTKESAANKQQH